MKDKEARKSIGNLKMDLVGVRRDIKELYDSQPAIKHCPKCNHKTMMDKELCPWEVYTLTTSSDATHLSIKNITDNGDVAISEVSREVRWRCLVCGKLFREETAEPITKLVEVKG